MVVEINALLLVEAFDVFRIGAYEAEDFVFSALSGFCECTTQES